MSTPPTDEAATEPGAVSQSGAAPGGRGPLIELSGITKTFGANLALEHVDLNIGVSESVGIIGDNGAGKSTLVKILSGVYRPTSGEMHLAGKKVEFHSPLDARSNGIEMIYQDLALCGDLDIAANIFLGRELKRRVGPFNFLDRDRMAEIARNDVANLGLDLDVHREVGKLSGGERQMVAVARALQFKPRALLMDEPTAALSTEKIKKTARADRRAQDARRVAPAGQPPLHRHPACLRSGRRHPWRQGRRRDAAPRTLDGGCDGAHDRVDDRRSPGKRSGSLMSPAVMWKRFFADKGPASVNPGLIVALVVVFVVLCFTSPYFLTSTNLLNIAKALVVAGIAAAGETIVIIAGGFDLSIGSTMAASGMLSAYMLDSGFPISIAFACSILLGVLIGATNGTIISHFRVNPLITTLAMLAIIRGLAFVISDGREIVITNQTWLALGTGKFLGIPLIVLLLVVLYLAFMFIIPRTTFGRYIYAIGSNARAARLWQALRSTVGF